MPRRMVLVFVVATAAVLCETPRHGIAAAESDWTQWGGPHRNFISDSKGLASTWPPGGPRKLWARALGEGHSSILVDGDRLYTMYRPVSGRSTSARHSQEEVVAA